MNYAALDRAELSEQLADISTRLSGAYTELGQIKIQYMWLYYQGYKAATELGQETSVSGREHQAEMAALAVKEDEVVAQSNIDSLVALRDLIVELRRE